MEQHVLQRDDLKLELAGRAFTWPRPVRSVARAQLADLMEIMDLQIADKTKPTGAEAAQCLRAANKVLAFLYKYDVKLSAKRAYFDDAAGERELMDIAKAVQEFLVVPMSGSANGTPTTEAEAEPETATAD